MFHILSLKQYVNIQNLIPLTLSILFGLSFGIDKYYSSLIPIEAFKAIPLVFFFCLAAIYLQPKILINKTIKFSYAMILWGLAVSLIRYNYFYSHEYTWLPILRHFIAISIGLFLYSNFASTYKNISLNKISASIILTSIPFLMIGLYQQFTLHIVGIYPRVNSLFSEPSYYGDYLVLLLAPTLGHLLTNFFSYGTKERIGLILYTLIWTSNLYASQSGTAIIKLGCLFAIAFLFYPIKLKTKATYLIISSTVIIYSLYTNTGRVSLIINYGLEILRDPQSFFKYHTFYDRFYPIYAAFKKLLTLEGILGLGFGGDYFEFKNLFPESTHAEMIAQKPTLSYFNSFASKIILFFGIPGLIWLMWLFKQSFKAKNPILKIALLNVLVASLWGVSNFALPYIWFWLALVTIEIGNNQTFSFNFFSKKSLITQGREEITEVINFP